MSFTRANTLGWAPFEQLTATQINQIDLNQSRAIDGNAGGTYSPSSDIVLSNPLAGAGMKYSGGVYPKLNNYTRIEHYPAANLFFGSKTNLYGSSSQAPDWAIDPVKADFNGAGSTFSNCNGSIRQNFFSNSQYPEGRLMIPVPQYAKLDYIKMWVEYDGGVLTPTNRAGAQLYKSVTPNFTAGVSTLSGFESDAGAITLHSWRLPAVGSCTDTFNDLSSFLVRMIEFRGTYGTNRPALIIWAVEIYTICQYLTPG